MIVTTTFARATFRVEAARVTTKNLDEIAEWCGGRIANLDDHGRVHVKVPTGNINGREQIAHAYIGTWVTCLEKTRNFRVYKEKSFTEAFREVLSEEEKYARVHELIMKVRNAQDTATYYGDTSDEVLLLVDKTAREICKIV
jgi:hypothetical protein